ncbi:MAG: hypothetical protein O0X93_03865 [Methanocorpusculum sp.]|nr:hypothetical protein [Methanocorpusculum sp.]MDE2522286.1 hypothetical protein [Methanocorpusculum sp.]MDE2523655.1 hypothetical protein [Methanocorpusculum sp.]
MFNNHPSIQELTGKWCPHDYPYLQDTFDLMRIAAVMVIGITYALIQYAAQLAGIVWWFSIGVITSGAISLFLILRIIGIVEYHLYEFLDGKKLGRKNP